MLNAVFSALVDAYIDRFIVAANQNDGLKLKLFEKVAEINPLHFTLTNLASKKDSKNEPIDMVSALSDSTLF